MADSTVVNAPWNQMGRFHAYVNQSYLSIYCLRAYYGE